jgi:hypothetical protein
MVAISFFAGMGGGWVFSSATCPGTGGFMAEGLLKAVAELPTEVLTSICACC